VIANNNDFYSGVLAFLREFDLVIALNGPAGSKIVFPIIAVTPLGQELMALIPSRDAKEVARKVANAIKKPEIEAAYFGRSVGGRPGEVGVLEVIWQKDAPTIDEAAAPHDSQTSVLEGTAEGRDRTSTPLSSSPRIVISNARSQGPIPNSLKAVGRRGICGAE
jgi:hypothetical protein